MYYTLLICVCDCGRVSLTLSPSICVCGTCRVCFAFAERLKSIEKYITYITYTHAPRTATPPAIYPSALFSLHFYLFLFLYFYFPFTNAIAIKSAWVKMSRKVLSVYYEPADRYVSRMNIFMNLIYK